MHTKTTNRCTLLLVEDNDDHAKLVERQLAKAKSPAFEIRRGTTLADAVVLLENEAIDVLLLDLSLPDSEISDTLDLVLRRFPDVPLVVLTSLSDMDLAAEAVKRGAQDYLVKSELRGDLLPRTLRYAMERKRYSCALERSNAEFRRFASTVAHEIRNPINAVHSCISFLKRRNAESFDAQSREVLDKTEERVESLLQLISNLLRFAHVEPESQMRKVELGPLVEEVLALLEQDIRRNGATITHADLPEVYAERSLLQQVFQNLLSNSLSYCTDKPEIAISAQDNGSAWLFSVRDNGVGIPEESRETVFQIFKRLEDAKKVDGTGIGLALCRRIIEYHHGKIWVEPAPIGGTTVYFTLPKDLDQQSEVCSERNYGS